MQRLGAVLADELQIGSHMSEQTNTILNYVLAHSGEESLEGFDGSLFAYPEKAGNAQIDLVDQGEYLSFGVLDFINSDGVNLAEHPVLQAPGDHVLNRVETLSQEVRNASAFPSRTAARPAGQK